MTKRANPVWPDPTVWAQQLHDRLEKIGEDYQSTPWDVAADPESFEGLNLKQARAAEAILATCSALHELPLFSKSKGVAVLHDVAGALRDVVMGGTPRLFASVRTGSPGGDGVHRNYVKVQVVLAVRFLIEAHSLTEGAATKLVAKTFAAAGATGRKGHSLSPSTVQDWCNKSHPLAINPDYSRIDREVTAILNQFRNDPAWPGAYPDTLSWIEKVAADPLLRSKYG